MAMTSVSSPNGEPSRQRGSGIVLDHDRGREYARARRSTLRVKALRMSLPLLAVGVLGLYVVSILKTAGFGSIEPQAAIRKILPQDLAMNNPKYEGFGSDGSSYVFQAKTAQQNLANPILIALNGITGTLTQVDKTKTDFFAARGEYETKKSILELFEQIDVKSESGLKVTMTRATILTDENILTTKEPVRVEFPGGQITSKAMTLRQKAHEVTFSDAVVAEFSPPADAAAATTAAAAPQAAGDVGALFKASDGPVHITADRLDVSDVTKIALFSGNVIAKQGDAVLKTQELEVTYDGGGMIGGDGKAPQTASAAQAASKIKRIVAHQPVQMTRGATDIVTSDQAEFDIERSVSVLFGNVVMTSGPEQKVTSDRVDIDQAANTVQLVGNVIVSQGVNELKGRRLFIDRAKGQALLTSPPGLGAGPGRVAARLSRGGEGKTGAKAAAKPAPDDADGEGNALGQFKTDPTAPIDIEADQLTVDDGAHVAVFKGDVKAKQGDFSMKSAELQAFYKGEAGLSSAIAAPGQAAKPGGSAELTRVEAKRDVVVKSAEGRTAKGDWANFDMKANKVVMGGTVLLAQGPSMVRGTRLVIDMATGETKIDTSAAAQAVAQPTSDMPTQQAGSSGRASAVFFPKQLKESHEAQQKGKSGTPPPPDGWAATADPANGR